MEYQKFIPEGWYNTKEEFSINKLEKAMKTGDVIQGFVYKFDEEYNLYVKLGENLEGIIPKDEIDLIEANNIQPKVGIYKSKVNNFVQFKVKEICNDSKVLLSRKDVCSDAMRWANEELKSGMVVNGIVKNIRPYGVFVEIGGGVVGLIHIQDISISRMKNPNERFYIGQKIKTMIKSIDNENSRVILTYKELLRQLGG